MVSRFSFPQFVQQRGPSFSLGERGLAKIDCGATTFLLHATSRPRPVPVPFLNWRWAEQAYTVCTAATLLLFLLMISACHRIRSRSLSTSSTPTIDFWMSSSSHQWEKEEEIPAWLKKPGLEHEGGKGSDTRMTEGVMGKKTSKNKEGLVAIKGPKDNQEQYLAKKLAEENAKTAGILGVIRMSEGSHVASIFGRETALAPTRPTCLGVW